MARRAITQEIYNALLTAYREHPAGHGHARVAAGVDSRTAKKAWQEGWPKLGWAPPIKGVVEEEQKEARARLAVEQAKATNAAMKAGAALPQGLQGAAKEDALDSRVKEAQLVRLARDNTLLLLGSVQGLLKGTFELSKQAKDLVVEAKLSPMQLSRFYANVAKVAHEANDAGRLAMHLERQLVGAPTEIIGIASVSLSDAEREAREALEMIEEAKAAGLIPSGEGTPDGSTNVH